MQKHGLSLRLKRCFDNGADGIETVSVNGDYCAVGHPALKEQAAQIQKVSDQLEASKPAPRLVTDGQ
jgi:hypothetical protein